MFDIDCFCSLFFLLLLLLLRFVLCSCFFLLFFFLWQSSSAVFCRNLKVCNGRWVLFVSFVSTTCSGVALCLWERKTSCIMAGKRECTTHNVQTIRWHRLDSLSFAYAFLWRIFLFRFGRVYVCAKSLSLSTSSFSSSFVVL